ncbi:MAG TPA: ABC transporter permease [Streptosporangiaceae bacterium]|nr:ABC transporter permease [Streptosporangiaceae bacterium]
MAVPVADALPPVLPAGDMPAAGRLSPARQLMRSLEVAIPAAVLALLLFFCFIWPLVYPVPPPVGGSILDSGLPMWSPGHIFGTDTVGNDIMSRILYGGRVSFEVAAAVQVIGLAVGGLLGLIAGYRGGTLEAVLMRVLDVFIAFPSLVLVLAIVDSLGQSELNVILALSVFSIPAFARITRAATLQLRDQPFVVAARLSSVKTWRILAGHIVPNVMPQLLTFSLLGAGIVIILEGALDFLGYGIPDPTASWGKMIAAGQTMLSVSPSLVIVPSIFLFVTVVCLNMLGDGLRALWGVR